MNIQFTLPRAALWAFCIVLPWPTFAQDEADPFAPPPEAASSAVPEVPKNSADIPELPDSETLIGEQPSSQQTKPPQTLPPAVVPSQDDPDASHEAPAEGVGIPMPEEIPAQDNPANTQPKAPTENPTNVNSVPKGPRIKLANKLVKTSGSILIACQTGGDESRAVVRPLKLEWNEWQYQKVFVDGKLQLQKMPQKNMGPVMLKFSEGLDPLQNAWNNQATRALANRYANWPKEGIVNVQISGQQASSQTAVAATALCFESMARNLSIKPTVAVMAHLSENGTLECHPQTAHIVLGYDIDWSDILLVGAAQTADFTSLTQLGLVSPFLSTQIIAANTMDEAMSIVTGDFTPEMEKAMSDFRTIQNLRSKMQVQEIARSRPVQAKLQEIVTAMPSHLSAAMLLEAGKNQGPLSASDSARISLQLFQTLNQLAGGDSEWVGAEEGAAAIRIFKARMKELQPRLDTSLNRYNIKIDEAARAIEDLLRLRDRTTSTGIRRIETVRTQVSAVRTLLEQAAGQHVPASKNTGEAELVEP